jgi:hypothetical protein
MTVPACSLWWLLAAVLLGWLLCGWFARQYLPLVSGADTGPPASDVAAARAAGPALAGPDDLSVIEGVGPKIAQIFQAAGVRSFAQVAAMTPAGIQRLLDEAGPNFRIADPQTWPEQAALAAANRWAELKALQDELVGGRKA